MIRNILLLLYVLTLLKIAAEDFRYHKIRNKEVVKIVCLAIAGMFLVPEISVSSRLMGMFVVSLPMFVIDWIRPGSFGGGDLKLTFACGAFLGEQKLIFGTIAGIFFVGIFAICVLCRKKRKNTRFALGPCLALGYVLSTFCIIFKK